MTGIVEDLTAWLVRYDSAWINARWQALSALLDADVVMVAPGFGQTLEGKEAVLRSFQHFAHHATVRNYKRSRLQCWGWGDTAVATFEWSMTWQAGDAEQVQTGREVLTLVSRDGDWRLAWRTMLPATAQRSER